mgnify:CR=1 FL=1
MSDRVFYAAAEDPNTHEITGYVPSKFLIRNGAYVVDPVPGASQNANLYSDNLGSDRTNGKIANPNNYVVVPANYSSHLASAVVTVSSGAPVGPLSMCDLLVTV